MRHSTKFLTLAITLFALASGSQAQTHSLPQPKCDGKTDDTAALQAAINSAASQATKLVLPQGTCMLFTQTVSLPDGLVLQGAGRDSTILRRLPNSGSSTDMFRLTGKTGSVAISDVTLDYNRSSQLGVASILGSSSPTVTNFTLQHSRLINAPLRAIFFHAATSAPFPSSIAISDNDFQNNGAAKDQNTDQNNGDIFIDPASGIRILNNTAENTHGSFFLTGTGGNLSGMGDITIIGNVLNRTEGFGIALGGGGPGRAHGSNVIIRDNDFTMPNSRENDIDVAYWDTVLIDHNHLISGSCMPGCAAIGDAPPSSHITVTDNTIVAGSALVTSTCIALGGPGQIIRGNSCTDSGGTGILLFGDSTGSTGSIIENNTVKNCNQTENGFPAGISLYLYKGTHMEGVTVRGNHSYDDRGPQATQTWGIIIDASAVDPAAFKDITVENNDVRNNKRSGIENNAHKSTNIRIRSNPGAK